MIAATVIRDIITETVGRPSGDGSGYQPDGFMSYNSADDDRGERYAMTPPIMATCRAAVGYLLPRSHHVMIGFGGCPASSWAGWWRSPLSWSVEQVGRGYRLRADIVYHGVMTTKVRPKNLQG
jgi:hypothetical protein